MAEAPDLFREFSRALSCVMEGSKRAAYVACTDVMIDPDWLLDKSATKNIEISIKLPLKSRIEINNPTLNALNGVKY